MDPKIILKQHGLKPSRGLGQNFLVDKDAINKIIEAADLRPEDTVLEIGPGLGVLTQELAKRIKMVIAVEKDRNMVGILEKTLKDYKNTEIVRGDIRFLISEISEASTSRRCMCLPPGGESLISEIKKSNFKVVGNLPFYLTAPVIRHLLEYTEARPLCAVFVVQKEVAQRICAKPPKMNLLAVSVQIYAEPEIISYIPRESFWPVPDVDAAILKIRSTKSPPDFACERTRWRAGKIQNIDINLFFKIVKAGFSQPRKQLANNLASGLRADKAKIGEWLLGNNIRPTQRAETLSVTDWLRLTKNYKME